ncbi:hypothetical protein AB6C62_06130 [Vibrio splendidus]|uniref:hypothetical protein n=1 Tax=Vibrio splendidus TaxID=29497 RepID=UPI000C85099E|nr:hypothetical protein [Vibrio splendidus]PMO23507.1 hypothetical protein BCT15_02420 [Vibrio splendidus]
MSLANIKSHIGPYTPNWIKYGLNYYKAIREIYNFHALSGIEKNIYIKNKTLNSICQAYDKTSFYHDLYKSYNINPHKFKTLNDLSYLPIISKSDIINNVDELLINTVSKDDVICANTGGSTGNPLQLYRSQYEMVQELAYLDFHLSKLYCNYSWLNKKKLILRGNTYKGDVVARLGCNLIISSQLLNSENIYSVVEKIKDFSPLLIHAYPSSLMKLLDLLQVTNQAITIPYLLTSSEVITQQQLNLAKNALNTQYLDLYGNSEHSALAINIKGQYEFDMSYGYTEFVKGKLISTKLLDTPMPLIRYDCGDTYLVENILTDSTSDKSLTSIGGRVAEYVYDSLKNKLPVVSLIYGQHYQFFDAVTDFSLVQDKPGVLTIEYVAVKPLNQSEVFNAEEIINKITNNRLNLSFKKVDSIRVNRNGKRAFLVKGNDYD